MDVWNTLSPLLKDLPDGQHLFLYGPPGTGKTLLGSRIGEALKRRCYTTACHDTLTVEELFFRAWCPEAGVTRWELGPALLAWTDEAGAILQWDEVDRLGPDVFAMGHAVLGGAHERVTVPDGRTLAPAVDESGRVRMRCIGTSNQPPSALPPAIADRFAFRVPILRPSDEALATLPEELRRPVLNAYEGCGWSDENPDARPLLTFREAAAYATARGAGLPEEAASFIVWGEAAPSILAHIEATKAPTLR